MFTLFDVIVKCIVVWFLVVYNRIQSKPSNKLLLNQNLNQTQTVGFRAAPTKLPQIEGGYNGESTLPIDIHVYLHTRCIYVLVCALRLLW